jgi:hypothetical protein
LGRRSWGRGESRCIEPRRPPQAEGRFAGHGDQVLARERLQELRFKNSNVGPG